MARRRATRATASGASRTRAAGSSRRWRSSSCARCSLTGWAWTRTIPWQEPTGGTMHLSSADHSVTPPRVEVPREYNAAYDLIERNLGAGRAGKVAFHDDSGSVTYAQLAARVNRFGSGLMALGLRMEDRVLLAMHDTADWPVAFLGAIRAGIVPVAVNTLLTTKDYQYMLSDSRAIALVVSEALMPQFKPI